MIRFKCKHCAKMLSVKEHLAGKRASCPACRQVVVIPAPVATAADVEAVAASALEIEPKPASREEPAEKPITFTCDYCSEEVTLPYELAGKQSPCPNPDCKRIIKVPLPKVEKTGDWREASKRIGPSGALINQVQKIEGVWDARDHSRVGSEALAQAGAITAPPRKPLGLEGWIRRALWLALLLATAVAGLFIVHRLNTERADTQKVQGIEQKLDPRASKDQPALAKAEVSRFLGLYLLRHSPRENRAALAQEKFIDAARFAAQSPGPRPETKKGSAAALDVSRLNEELYLIDLARTQIELGGNEEQVSRKERLDWKSEMRPELARTLERIKTPELRLWALREVSTRLLEKGQAELALSLASTLGYIEGNRTLAHSQKLALEFSFPQAAGSKGKGDSLPPMPDLTKEIEDPVMRCGYSEGLARQKKYAQALEVARVPSKAPRDRIDACLGVAALAAGDPAAQAQASAALQEALQGEQALAEQKSKHRSPYQTLLMLRVALELQAGKMAEEALALLPYQMRPRGHTDLFIAACERASSPIPISEIAVLEAKLGDEASAPLLALAWEALGRHYDRLNATDYLHGMGSMDASKYKMITDVGIELHRHGFR